MLVGEDHVADVVEGFEDDENTAIDVCALTFDVWGFDQVKPFIDTRRFEKSLPNSIELCFLSVIQWFVKRVIVAEKIFLGVHCHKHPMASRF